MRILIVAPDQAGVSVSEIVVVAHRNQPMILSGMVTIDHLEAVLQREQFEIIHFMQHGTHNVLHMSDAMMHEEQLLRMLSNQVDVRLVFINACNSAGIAARLHNALGCITVAHAAPINDALALIYAREFYRCLSTRFDPHQADQVAFAALEIEAKRLAITDYVKPILINGDMNTLHELEYSVKRLQQEQEKLVQSLAEIKRWMRVVVPLNLLLMALIIIEMVYMVLR